MEIPLCVFFALLFPLETLESSFKSYADKFMLASGTSAAWHAGTQLLTSECQRGHLVTILSETSCLVARHNHFGPSQIRV